MRKAIPITVLLLMIAGVIFYAAIRTDRLYKSHISAVNDTIDNLLERRDRHLPRQAADLALDSVYDLSQDSAAKVIGWRIEAAEADNTQSFVASLLDDDPIYRLKADLLVTYDNGEEAVVGWESWRYGFVLGPVVVSMGDGPPGYIVSVSPATPEEN